MKKCFKCGVGKPLQEFYKHKRMADGHLGKCIECTKRDVSENYRKRRDKYAEYERSRWERPERRAAAARYQRKSRALRPERAAAYRAVRNAVVSGRLQNPSSCVLCCKIGRVEAHHEDYGKPLDVVWLCRACHLAEHGKVAFSLAASAAIE